MRGGGAGVVSCDRRCKVPSVWWRRPEFQIPFQRIQVDNPSDGGFWHWLLKFYGFGLLCVAGLMFLGGLGAYVYFSSRLPVLPDLDRYQQEAAESTQLRAWDGTILADWARQRREILSSAEVPRKLIQAFVAIEDRRFFEHGGIDYRGILRAALANLRAGGVAQGGSTITQQVARSFFERDLFFARSFLRKIPEAILARRLEARFSKEEILTLYLNQIFLGQTAYGVGAAARRYFDKSIDALDLGEMATIAGIARAPSRFSPVSNMELARKRRDQVLAAMVAAGYIDQQEADSWRARPIVLRPPPDFFGERSPHFAEHVRRDIDKRYGKKLLWEGGLQIETTLLPGVDAIAQDSVDHSLRKLDKRQGWRGAVAKLRPAEMSAFRKRAAARYGGDPPEEGRLYLGLVESNTKKGARVRVGSKVYDLPPQNMRWASPYNPRDPTNDVTLDSTFGVMRKGDVVWVSNAHRSNLGRFSDWTYDEKRDARWEKAYENKEPPPGPPVLQLEQTPRVQGASYSYDHHSGYVVAMVGGHDFDRSQFNRVTQACRQPGSTYKAIYYSLALDKGFGYSSMLNDVPRAEVDPITGEVWIPTNLNNTVEYQVTLDYSLVWSKNVPSVQLFKLVGGREVEAWARRLGMTTEIIPDQALALGASCVRIDELTRSFSAFARNGILVDPISVRRVRDREGNVLEDNTSVGDPMGAPSVRLDRLVALARQEEVPIISPRTAWLTSRLLRRVVSHGHSGPLRVTEIPAAGKTGTSSDTMDVWFVGYTSKWMNATWIGDDKYERMLGFKDAAFMLAVPMFARFIYAASQGQELQEIPWERPEGVKRNDTGGTLRTTAEELDDLSPRPKKS